MPRVQYNHRHDMEQFSSFRPTTYHHHHQFTPTTVLQRLGLEPHFLLQQQLQYLQYNAEPLDLNYPLDLSLKTPTTTTTTVISNDSHDEEIISPPCTPSPNKRSNTCTPEQPVKKPKPVSSGKKSKATRKLNFDEDNSSPVSGTIIRELRPDETLVIRKGDIDPAFNVVEITEEAKAELAKIENHIGDYVCRLCRELYDDAFGLAQHRCSRIVHVEYRCPDCDKVFNCPANLASHRRWHKPRGTTNNHVKDKDKDKFLIVGDEDELNSGSDQQDSAGSVEQFPCNECGKKFRRLAYLRKHQTVHQQAANSD